MDRVLMEQCGSKLSKTCQCMLRIRYGRVAEMQHFRTRVMIGLAPSAAGSSELSVDASFHSMSLHARCPQRIAGISANRTLRRWRGARCYASYTTKEPEWFQKKRNILLARKRHHHHELLDVTGFSELRATLEGFEPDFDYGSSAPVKLQRVHLSTLLTRFNARVAASQLFADGTDPLHSPGKLWPRRMWAGGAVRVNPHPELDSETPFRLMQMVSCVERIKDVRLLGSDEKANIVVTVERSYTPHGTTTDWSSAWVKEERNLVFLKAKTAAELTSIHAGELLVPKYLEGTTILTTRVRLLTCLSSCRTRLHTFSYADPDSPFPILCHHVQCPPLAPRPHVRPKH
jgi:hypothetical protein